MSHASPFRPGPLLASLLLAVAPAAAQDTGGRGYFDEAPVRRAPDARSVLARLEAGMSALEELDRHDALALLRRIADEVRQGAGAAAPRPAERDGARTVRPRPDGAETAPRPIESLDRRIAIVRLALEALARSGDAEGARELERFLHVAELQRAGAPGDAILDAYEGLSMASTIGLLRRAAVTHAERGRADEAAACDALARFYAAREPGRSELAREGARAEPALRRRGARATPDAPRSLESRPRRLEILRQARGALERAGDVAAAALLRRFVHVGELQESGASAEELAQAFAGLSIRELIGLLERSAGVHREQGRADRAAACASLADYYRRREGASPRRDAAAADAELQALTRRVDDLQAELHALRARIAELRPR